MNEIQSKERTVLRVGATDVELTLADAQGIQKALLHYLQQSTYPDREELLKWSGPAFIDAGGGLRVGLWLLGAHGEEMFLRFREHPGPLAARAHRATLARPDGEWTIAALEPEQIRVRPESGPAVPEPRDGGGEPPPKR